MPSFGALYIWLARLIEHNDPPVKTKSKELKQDTIIIKDFHTGKIPHDENSNTVILNATIDYLICTKRFENSIFTQ